MFRRALTLTLAALALAAILIGWATPARGASRVEITSDTVTMVNDLIARVNTERVNRGLAALAMDPTLTTRSQQWANRLRDQNNGQPHSDANANEIITASANTARVHTMFMNADSSRRALLGTGITRIGAGVACGQPTMWAVIQFSNDAGDPSPPNGDTPPRDPVVGDDADPAYACPAPETTTTEAPPPETTVPPGPPITAPPPPAPTIPAPGQASLTIAPTESPAGQPAVISAAGSCPTAGSHALAMLNANNTVIVAVTTERQSFGAGTALSLTVPAYLPPAAYNVTLTCADRAQATIVHTRIDPTTATTSGPGTDNDASGDAELGSTNVIRGNRTAFDNPPADSGIGAIGLLIPVAVVALSAGGAALIRRRRAEDDDLDF